MSELAPVKLDADEPNGDDQQATATAQDWGLWPTLFRLVPALDSLRSYRLPDLRADVLAGITVAAVAVPQAMAYAMIAGIPPVYGLYTAIVMTAVGALFDSSRQLINGPTNAISIALFSALAPVAGLEDKIAAAVLLALLVGMIQTAITLLRLGDLSRYISHSVIVGFTLGAGLLLVLDQLKNLLGLKAMGDVHDHFLDRFWLTLTAGSGIHWPTALIGLGTIGLILLIRWMKGRRDWPLLPEFLIVVILMAGVVVLSGLEQADVKVVGEIPAGLPTFQLPQVQPNQVRELSGSALAIAVLGLLEAIAMAKAIAAQTRQKLDINQQCLSEGLANLTGSFFRCFPGSGSLTRSAINQQAGAVTQWSGVISAVAVALIMLLFAPFARHIPRAALAGILIVSAWRMVDRRQLIYHLRATRFDAGIVLITAVSAVAISIEFCVLIGVFMSFLLYVPRAARLHLTEFILTPERVLRERQKDDPVCGKILIFNLEGEMFFGSATDLEEHLATIEERASTGVRIVVLRLKRVRNPDAVSLDLIDRFLMRMAEHRVQVLLCGVRRDLAKVVSATGLAARLEPNQIFLETRAQYSSTLEAVRHAYDLLGEDLCQTCPRRGEATTKEPLYYMI